MPSTHPPYAPEYRRRIIELARAGRSINELAREFEPSANAIRKWVKQAALDGGLRSDGLTTAEREELNRLRREIVARWCTARGEVIGEFVSDTGACWSCERLPCK